MTKEEYTKKFSSSEIGLCEICINFRDCLREGTVRENGCDKLETDNYSDQY